MTLPGTSIRAARPASRALTQLSHTAQTRRIFGWGNVFGGSSGRKEPSHSKDADFASRANNPILEQFLTRKPQPNPAAMRPAQGALTSDSIFADAANTEGRPVGAKDGQEGPTASGHHLTERNPQALMAVLDPKPKTRQRWEKKQIIRMVRKGGRLTKEERIAQTERQNLTKSVFFSTSVKKLNMLARQIQGKSVEEALVQMRFSKKKVARDVAAWLEIARDEAIVAKGMGLGPATGTQGEPAEIELKRSAAPKLVTDRTALYIDQAWVGRGPYGREPEYRARGRVNILRTPKTSISFLLKEEATRIRQTEEARQKRANRKVRPALPDRPIVQQRQYLLW